MFNISFLGAIKLLFSGYSKINDNNLLKDAINKIVLFHEDQIKHLEDISLDIASLKQDPMFSAKIFLMDATKSHRTVQERIELIVKAKEKLIDALGIIDAKFNKNYYDYHYIGIIQYFIALCWSLLLKKEDADDWLLQCSSTVNFNQQFLHKEINEYQINIENTKRAIEMQKKMDLEKKSKAIGIGLTVFGVLTLSPMIALGGASMAKNNKRLIDEKQNKYKEMELVYNSMQKICNEAKFFQELIVQTTNVLNMSKVILD